MRLFSILLALLVLSGTAYGANLVELQQIALSKREVIDRFKANREISKQNETIARSGYYPSLDASYTLNRLHKSNLLEEKENSVAFGALTWNLFSGLRDKYNLKSAVLLKSADTYRLKGIRQDIMRNVSLRYLSIFNRQAELQVAEDFNATLLNTYSDAQNRFNVGIIKKNDLLKFKVDLDNAFIILKQAQADLAKSINLLQREIDEDIKFEELTFTEFDQLPMLKEYQLYETEMLKNRSEILVLQDLAEAAEAQIKVEYARYAPSLDLTGSYRKYDDDFINGSGDMDLEEVRGQLALSINLFDGFEKSSRVSRAKLEARAIRHDLAEIKNDLTTRLRNLFLDYEVSSENAEVARESIVQAEENLRVTRLSYKEGIATETDYLDAITNLSRARSNYVSAKSEVFANYFDITRAVEGF